MNSAEIGSHYFLSEVTCLLASLEYLGMEWMIKGFLSDTTILFFLCEHFPFFSSCPGVIYILLFSLAHMNSCWSSIKQWSWWRLRSQPSVVLRIQEEFRRCLSSSFPLGNYIVVVIAMLYRADRSLSYFHLFF